MIEEDPSNRVGEIGADAAESRTPDNGVAAVIDVDEFKSALVEAKDPTTTLGKFMAEASAYRVALVEDGRSA